MIKQQTKGLSYVEILLLHALFALVVYLYRPFSALLLFGILLYFTFIIIQNENRNNEALMAAAYISGAEVFFRMTDGMVFYETGKYSVIIFLVIGMFFKGTSSKTVPFWMYLLILIPGIIVASITISYDAEFRKLIAFNLSGPVTVGVSALYCYYKKIKKKDFERVIVMLLMPLICQMFYLYLYTPTLKEGIISLSGNYAATAGYGPNQISTVLGMGAFLLVTRLFVIKNRYVNILDFILLGMMGYRAVITFSRGGVFTAIICMVAFIIFYYYKQNKKEINGINSKIIMLITALVPIWFYSSFKTFGLIENRYKSENAAGELKTDITTGRSCGPFG